MSLMFILKVASIALTGFFAIYGLINPYKDASGNLTQDGKIAIIGTILSTLITLSIFLFDTLNPPKTIIEAENFPLDDLSVTMFYKKTANGFTILQPKFYKELKKIQSQYHNKSIIGESISFPGVTPDNVSLHIGNEGEVDYFTYHPKITNVIPSGNLLEDSEELEFFKNKSGLRGLCFKLDGIDSTSDFSGTKKTDYDLVLSKHSDSSSYKIYPPDYNVEKTRNFALKFEYDAGTIRSFKDLSKCSLLFHISSKDFASLTIRNKKGQFITSDPSSIKFYKDNKSGKGEFFVSLSFLDINSTMNSK